jgi:hypothetical protein
VPSESGGSNLLRVPPLQRNELQGNPAELGIFRFNQSQSTSFISDSEWNYSLFSRLGDIDVVSPGVIVSVLSHDL